MGRNKSASTVGLRAALVGLASIQADVNSILSLANIQREVVDNPEGRVSLEQVSSFWNIASNELGIDHIGLDMANLIPFGTYQTSDYLLSSSANLREGLNRFIRFFTLIHQELGINSIESKSSYELQLWSLDKVHTSRHSLEFEIALLYKRIKYITQKNFHPLVVKFTHDLPPQVIKYYEDFFNCPVKPNQSLNSMTFDVKYLEYHCIDADSTLADLLESNAKKMIDRIPKIENEARPPFLIRFNEVLKQELKEGKANIKNMSNIFGMSARSLQRKLKEYNLSYSEVLTNLRIELSKDLLNDQSLSMTEIAFLLGFSESSAFQRAFKQWTSLTPSEYRKKFSNIVTHP